MLEVKELRKQFGPITAVDGVSFTAEKGDVVGFLGPNGAGKSTTMNMLSCFMPPDSGTASILGHDILKESIAVRQKIGYLAENAPGYDEMTVAGMLGFVCDARGIRGSARRDAIDDVIVKCAIEEVFHQPVGTLSKGYQRRLGLAQALIHDPDVLLLDEPTDGLDPNQKHDVRQLIDKMAKHKCIVISTHILEEVDAICNRIVLLAEGRVVADSTPDDLRGKHKGDLEKIFRKLTLGKKKEAAA